MKQKNEYKSFFENRPKYRYLSYSSHIERGIKTDNDQKFVVPWQMINITEKKIVFE